MVKVMYHGEIIEIPNELEKGELELDTLEGFGKESDFENNSVKPENDSLEDTLEIFLTGDNNE